MTSHFRTPPSPLSLHPNLCPSQVQQHRSKRMVEMGQNLFYSSPPLPFLSNPHPPSSLHQKYPPPPPRFPTTGAGGSLRKKRRGGAWGKSKNWGAVELASIRGWVLPIGRNAIEIKTRTTPAPISPPSALPGIKRKERESWFFFFKRFSGKEGTAGVPELRRSHKFSPPPISPAPLLRPPCLKRVGGGV